MTSIQYSKMLQSSLSNNNNSIIDTNFIGTKKVLDHNDEWVQLILQETKAYTDTAIQENEGIKEIFTDENGGLVVTNKNNINFDDEITFILDCNEDIE